MSEKKIRAPNFTAEEKMLCLSLIKKYSGILENKKTDGVSWREKEAAWEKITTEFNMQSPSFINRTTTNLRTFYENKKKESRKIAAEERKSRYKTGGGPPTKVIDPLFDITMDILNKKCIVGLEDRFGGDCIKSSAGNSSEIIPEQNEIIEIHVVNDDLSENETNANEEENEDIEKLPGTSTWANYKSSDLKKPASDELKTKKKWVPRRRPIIPSHTGTLTARYEELANIKVEVAKLQLELLKDELKHKKHKQIKELEEIEERKRKIIDEGKLEVVQKKIKLEHLEEQEELKKQLLLLEIALRKTQIEALKQH